MTNRKPRTACPASSRSRRWTTLLQLAQKGDEFAFVELMEEFRPYLLRRLRSSPTTEGLFETPDDVEDSFQDLNVAAWRGLPSFDATKGVATTWLWTIARNCAVNYLRDRTRRRQRELYDREGRLTVDVPANGLEPGEQLSRNEDAGRCAAALESVLADADPQVREAWLLRTRDGMPYEDIATTLDVPKGTVATWLSRVKQRVRQRLAAE